MRERANDELRRITIEKDYISSCPGSALVSFGRTRVICTATVEPKAPPHAAEAGHGWLSAEYAMLPGSTLTRKPRAGSRPDGRSIEIQRLIGRSLRSVVDMTMLPELTLWLDCDVIEADGGTRTASITGAFVALVLAMDKLIKQGVLPASPVLDYVAAVSCGIVDGEALLDLCYEEDSRAEVDMNFVITGEGKFVEVQGTGEKRAFTDVEFEQLKKLALGGTDKLIRLQRETLGELNGLIGR